MDAITSNPEIILQDQGVAATATSWRASAVIRAAAVGLVFSVAFSSSFVLGFYLLGPWIDAARTMM